MLARQFRGKLPVLLRGSPSDYPIALAVGLNSLQVLGQGGIGTALQKSQQIIQLRYSTHLQTQCFLHLLHRAVGHISCGALGVKLGGHFLAVQGNHHRVGFRTCSFDQAN